MNNILRNKIINFLKSNKAEVNERNIRIIYNVISDEANAKKAFERFNRV